MKKIYTREVVERVQSYLGNCSAKVIARYLGVTQVALSQNIERDFSEISNNKVGLRLTSLLYLLECAKKDETLDAPVLHRLLTLPSFVEKDGWKIDVVSAIHQDYSKEILLEIFQKSISVMRKPVDKRPVDAGLFNMIQAIRP